MLAYKKNKFKLTWNWINTFSNFIDNLNFNKAEIKLIVQQIINKWLNLSDIPANWEKLEVFDYINHISSQSEEIDFTNKDIEFITNIAKSFWANYFWIDIISNWNINDGYIIEINWKPDVLYAKNISKKFNDTFFSKVIDKITWEPFKKLSDVEAFLYNGNTNITEYWLSKKEYIEKIKSLKYLKNKDEILSSNNYIKNWIFILLDELEKNGCYYWIDKYWFNATIELPNWEKKLIYSWDYWFNSSVIRRIFEDKIYTSQILRNAWFKVANDMLVVKNKSIFSSSQNWIDACLEFASKNNYPLIFKPNNWSLWAWVQKIFNSKQLLNTLNQYNNNNNSWLFLLQEYVPWNDYRVIYLDLKILVAYKRVHAKINGNWKNTIKELIYLNNYNQIEKQVKEYLESQSINLDNILQNWEILELLPTANIATMGTVEEVNFDEEDRKFIESVAKTFNANYFWIDILATKKLSQWLILEINNWPITTWISKSSPWFKELFAKTIFERIKKG